jgi:hypothetical protein
MDSAEILSLPQLFSPAVLLSLQEALASVYWYKADLRSFLLHTLNDRSLVPLLDWQDRERSIMATLVGLLARDPGRYGGELQQVLREVSRVEVFNHLRGLGDGNYTTRQA